MRGSWRLNRTATYWPPLLWPSAFLSHSPGLLNCGPGAQPLWVLVFSTASYLQLVWSPTAKSGAWRLPLLGAGFLYHIVSPTGLVSKLTDFLSSPSYIIVQRPPSCGRHNFILIQPVHGQDYNILIIPRLDAPVIYIGAFPILTARPGRRSIYNRFFSPAKVTSLEEEPKNWLILFVTERLVNTYHNFTFFLVHKNFCADIKLDS